MKTKTITYHASLNNGSFFQAYALQKTIKSLGHDNEILDIQTPELKSDYALFRNIRSLSDLLKNIISLLHFVKLKKRKRKFEEARKCYLSLTSEYSSLNDYIADNQDEVRDSLFIAGSDQIWNTTTSDFTEGYFLPGIDNKIAYSASGGSSITSKDLQKYIQYIKEFKNISVREPKLKNILNNLNISRITVTLEPTLLLDKDDYKTFISNERYLKDRYIFCYSAKCNRDVMKKANEIGKHFGLPVYAIFNTYRSEKNWMYGLKNIYDAGPEDFLNILQNAELVLTDSFHGNVFSIIMEKPFYYLAPESSSKEIEIDDRIDGLFEQIGLAGRKITVNTPVEEIFNTEIEYCHVRDELINLRQESIEYLRNAIC